MKKFHLILSTLLIFSMTLRAQNKDEVSLTDAVKAFNKAMIDADRTQLRNLTAEELSYGHSSGKVQNKSEFVEDVISGRFDFKTIETPDQKVTMAGDLAIVRHTLAFTATNNGAPVEVKLGNLLVWRKDNGQWKLSARQAFKLP